MAFVSTQNKMFQKKWCKRVDSLFTAAVTSSPYVTLCRLYTLCARVTPLLIYGTKEKQVNKNSDRVRNKPLHQAYFVKAQKFSYNFFSFYVITTKMLTVVRLYCSIYCKHARNTRYFDNTLSTLRIKNISSSYKYFIYSFILSFTFLTSRV